MMPDFESDSTPVPQDSPVERLRFPLVYLFYGMTVLASGLATFGVAGIVPALIVLPAWAIVFFSSSRPRTLIHVVVSAAVLGLVSCCLFLPAVQQSREASRRGMCQNNIRQLAIALHNYHADFGSFPPVYVADANGKPRHSWRVLILPYLEQDNLYKAYKFDEPWNGPNNSLLAVKMPDAYRCPAYMAEQGASVGVPNYLAVVGPNTAWRGGKGLTLADMTDDMSTTLLLVESHHANMNWLEPRDISGDEVVALLSDDTPGHGTHHPTYDFFYEHADNGRMVAFVDHQTQYLGGLDAATARALVGRADGLVVKEDALYDTMIQHSSRPNYANWFRLGCFILIVLFPLPWVWRHPTGFSRRTSARTTE